MTKSLIHIEDKTFKSYISESQIQEAIARISSRINEDYKGKTPLFICILNGAFMFASDLLKHIDLSCQVSFVKVASYEGLASTGTVKKIIGLMDSLVGRDVIIIEDIIDTGNTLSKLLPGLLSENPASFAICSLLYKPDAFQASFETKYVGIEIPNKFIVGYGLDYNGYGRNLSDIYQIV